MSLNRRILISAPRDERLKGGRFRMLTQWPGGVSAQCSSDCRFGRPRWKIGRSRCPQTIVHTKVEWRGHLDCLSSRAADWILQIEDMREPLIVNINRKVTTDALFLVMAGDVPAMKRPKIR